MTVTMDGIISTVALATCVSCESTSSSESSLWAR